MSSEHYTLDKLIGSELAANIEKVREKMDIPYGVVSANRPDRKIECSIGMDCFIPWLNKVVHVRFFLDVVYSYELGAVISESASVKHGEVNIPEYSYFYACVGHNESTWASARIEKMGKDLMITRYNSGVVDARWSSVGSDFWEGRYRDVGGLIETFLDGSVTLFDVFNDEAFWGQLVFCDHVRGG